MNGFWDDEVGFKIPAGTQFKVWYSKYYAQKHGSVYLEMYAAICDVEYENSVTFIGYPAIDGSWQGYAYSFIPRQGATTVFKYETEPHIETDDGDLKIRKVDSTNATKGLDGVALRVRSVSNGYDQVFITSGGGWITVSELESGDYLISEEATIPFYELSTEIVPVTVRYGETATAVFKNVPWGETTVIKEDSVTGERVPGANIMLFCPSTGRTWDVVTGKDGTATIKVPSGDYYWQEQNAPPGYELNSQRYPVVVLPGQNSTIKILNNPLGELIITKVSSTDSKRTIAGVKIRVQNTSLSFDNIYTTDERG